MVSYSSDSRLEALASSPLCATRQHCQGPTRSGRAQHAIHIMPAPAGQDILDALITAYIKSEEADKTVMPTWDTTGALKRPFVEQVGERLPCRGNWLG